MKSNNGLPVMRINWEDQSLNDLREILKYVDSLYGIKRAEAVFSEIRDTVNLLLAFPLMGKEFVKDPVTSASYHTLPSKLHQIVYYIENETINIVAVWNNRRDIRRLKRRLRRT